MEAFTLTDLIEPQILQEIQDAFADYAGMAALMTDANGTPVTEGSNFTRFCMELTRKSELGAQKCEECDRMGAIRTLQTGKPVVYQCHAGLVDYAAPIMVNDEFIGSFIGGQVRIEPVDEAQMTETARKYGIDPESYIAAAKETNETRMERVEKAAEFLSKLASVLSKIAYQRYEMLQSKVKTESSSRKQADYLKDFADELKGSLGELTEYLLRSEDEEAMVLASSAMSLGSMLDDTMDYLSIENGDFELREAIYDIRRIVGMKVNEFRKAAGEKGDTIKVTIADTVPASLMGDPGRISSVIGKLIEDSIRFTENGTIRVDIDVMKETYCIILIVRVSDQGVGIDPESVRKITEYIASRGTSHRTNPEYEEMGFSLIGFAVNAMHGNLRIKSRLGAGTTFTVTLPQLAVEG